MHFFFPIGPIVSCQEEISTSQNLTKQNENDKHQNCLVRKKNYNHNDDNIIYIKYCAYGGLNTFLFSNII